MNFKKDKDNASIYIGSVFLLDVICITYFIDIHLLDLKTRHKLINADYRLHLLQSPIDIHWAKGYPPYDIGLYPIASKQVKLEDCVMEPTLKDGDRILVNKVIKGGSPV